MDEKTGNATRFAGGFRVVHPKDRGFVCGTVAVCHCYKCKGAELPGWRFYPLGAQNGRSRKCHVSPAAALPRAFRDYPRVEVGSAADPVPARVRREARP